MATRRRRAQAGSPWAPRAWGQANSTLPRESVFFKGIPLFLLFIYLFIYFWLCWVFVSVRGLSLVVASGGHSSSRCAVLSPSRPLLLRSTGSRRAGSVIVAHGPSCSAACGIFPDQGSNPCPLHWQEDSQLLRHQGSPPRETLNVPLSLLMGSVSPEVQDWTGDCKVWRDDRQPLLGPCEADLCPAITVSHTD